MQLVVDPTEKLGKDPSVLFGEQWRHGFANHGSNVRVPPELSASPHWNEGGNVWSKAHSSVLRTRFSQG